MNAFYKNILRLLGFLILLCYILLRFRDREDFIFSTDMSLKSSIYFVFIICIYLYLFILAVENLLKIYILKKNGKILNLISPYYLKLKDLILKPLIAFDNYLYRLKFISKFVDKLLFLAVKYNPVKKNILEKLIKSCVYVPKIIIIYYLLNNFFILNIVSTLYNVLPLLLVNIFIKLILYSLMDFCQCGISVLEEICIITKHEEPENNRTECKFILKDEYIEKKYNIDIIMALYCKVYYPGYFALENIKYIYDKAIEKVNIIYFPIIIFAFSCKLFEYLYF